MMKTKPPRTQCTIHVGITGHRDLCDANQFLLKEQIKKVLTAVVQGTNEVFEKNKLLYKGQAPLFRILSAIAEGADRLAAEEALTLNYELECSLPFDKEEYSKDFHSDESKTAFCTLMEKASSVQELGGTRNDEGQAYFDAGQSIIRNSDILVAVWDRERPSGTGGTGEIVAEASKKGMMVVHIDAKPPHNITLISNLKEAPNENWETWLFDYLKSIIAPFDDIHSESQLIMHELYFKEEKPRVNWNLPYNLFLDLVLWKGRNYKLRAADIEETKRDAELHIKEVMVNLPTDVLAKISDSFLKHYAWLDALAVHYAGLYRTDFLIKYLFGFFAVAGVLIGFYGSPSIQHIGFVGQFLFLGLIIFLIWIGKRRHWHERFIDYRVLAELIRHSTYLYLLGRVCPPVKFSAYNEYAQATWINWHLRNIVRETGLANVRMNADHLKDCWYLISENEINGQIDFYKRNTKNYQIISRRLEKAGILFFYLGILAICLRVGAYFYGLYHPEDIIVPDLKTFFNELSLLLPALGPVLMGIRSQGEFSRLADRYFALSQSLHQIYDLLKSRPALSLKDLSVLAESAAETMLSEVSDWRILVKGKALSAM